MKLDLKDMYKFLLSHTFPGLLFGVEILLFLYWFTNLPVSDYLIKGWKSNPVLLTILGYAFSTILGSVIDGIHHLFYEDSPSFKSFIKLKPDKDDQHFKRETDDAENKFKAVSDEHRLNTYLHFLEDDLYYPYEAWANISVVMVPGFFLLLGLLLRGSLSLLKVWSWNINFYLSYVWLLVVFLLLYCFIFFTMVFEAKYTLLTNQEHEKKFNAVFSKEEK